MDRKQLDELRQEKEELAEMEERCAVAFLGRVVIVQAKWRFVLFVLSAHCWCIFLGVMVGVVSLHLTYADTRKVAGCIVCKVGCASSFLGAD